MIAESALCKHLVRWVACQSVTASHPKSETSWPCSLTPAPNINWRKLAGKPLGTVSLGQSFLVGVFQVFAVLLEFLSEDTLVLNDFGAASGLILLQCRDERSKISLLNEFMVVSTGVSLNDSFYIFASQAP